MSAEAARYAPRRRSISPAARDAFFGRLLADGERRKAAHKAALTEMEAREATLLRSSKLWGISSKLCRAP